MEHLILRQRDILILRGKQFRGQCCETLLKYIPKGVCDPDDAGVPRIQFLSFSCWYWVLWMGEGVTVNARACVWV